MPLHVKEYLKRNKMRLYNNFLANFNDLPYTYILYNNTDYIIKYYIVKNILPLIVYLYFVNRYTRDLMQHQY